VADDVEGRHAGRARTSSWSAHCCYVSVKPCRTTLHEIAQITHAILVLGIWESYNFTESNLLQVTSCRRVGGEHNIISLVFVFSNSYSHATVVGARSHGHLPPSLKMLQCFVH